MASTFTLTPDEQAALRACAKDDAAYQSLLALVEGRLAACQAELDASQQLEAICRSLLEQRWQAVFIIDSESGSILDASAGAQALYGYPLDEIRHMNHTQFSAEPSETRRAVGEEKTHIPVRYHRRQNGEVFPVEITAEHFVWRGRKAHMVGIREITQDMTAEAALRESEERYRRLVELMPNGVVLHSGGKVLFANGAAARILRFATPNEMIGKPALQFVHPDYRSMALNRIQIITEADGGFAPPVVERFMRNDGQVVEVEVAAVAFPYKGETAVMVVFDDITHRKRDERQTFDLAVERERLNVLKSFIQDASHEFRTPLSVINSSLYLLARAGTPDKQQQYERSINEQVRRLTTLLDDMLMLAQLDSARAFRQAQLDLNNLLGLLLSGMKELRDSGHRLTVELGSELPPVEGDEELLRRAFHNILANAARYTPPGGEITVRTRAAPGGVVVEIADTGIGMSTETLRRIFQRFYREDKARTVPGFGLGLPMAQQIVEGHGGRIEVESEPGEGSLFRIWLPARRAAG